MMFYESYHNIEFDINYKQLLLPRKAELHMRNEDHVKPAHSVDKQI